MLWTNSINLISYNFEFFFRLTDFKKFIKIKSKLIHKPLVDCKVHIQESIPFVKTWVWYTMKPYRHLQLRFFFSSVFCLSISFPVASLANLTVITYLYTLLWLLLPFLLDASFFAFLLYFSSQQMEEQGLGFSSLLPIPTLQKQNKL